MDIRQIIKIVRRWILLLLLGTLLGGFGTYYLSARQTPIYQASTRFVVMRAAQTSYDVYSYLDSQQLISTYTQLLTTERLIDKASESLGYKVSVGQASAAQVGETQFVRLTVQDPNPEHAAAIANALVVLLINENEELQSVRYITAEQNLQNRIDDAQIQITALQSQINELSNVTVQEQLAEVETQINDLQTQILSLETLVMNYNEFTATPNQKAQYTTDKLMLDQLKPVLALYQQIYTNLVVLGVPIQDGDNTSNQLEQLQTTLNLYQQIYISSISSLENVRLSRAQNMPNVVQVEIASIPSVPISPKPLQSGLLGALIGFIVMAGIVFLVEYLDDTIKTPDDVKNILEIPVLGLIAEIKGVKLQDKQKETSVFVSLQPRSPVSEAFRSLRTNLEFSGLDRCLKTFLVTSSSSSEGKTTIASNLAMIQAQAKKRTLLIDCDLRRPNIHKHFNISNRLGLSDVLRGRIDFDEVIQQSSTNPYLHIMTSGGLPPNPAEFLGSKRLETFLEAQRAKYDIIILDTPPMVVADVQILASKVDGVLFVVHPGNTRAGIAKTALEDLGRVGANMLGVVLNRISKNRGYSYGAYKYYSSYTSQENHKDFIFDSSQQLDTEVIFDDGALKK